MSTAKEKVNKMFIDYAGDTLLLLHVTTLRDKGKLSTKI